jgi:hypothetical protein
MACVNIPINAGSNFFSITSRRSSGRFSASATSGSTALAH